MKTKLVSLLIVMILLMANSSPVSATLLLSNNELYENGLDFALFSGNDHNSLVINGSGCITGNVHSNNGFIHRGASLVIDGLCQTVGKIDVKESKVSISNRKINAQRIEMPDFVDNLREIAEEEADHYIGTKKYIGAQIELSNSVYVDGDVFFNCSRLSSEGYIMASGDVEIKSASFNIEQGVVIISENGDITLNGAVHSITGILYAPKGTVTINASEFSLRGRIIADKIVIRSSKFEIVSTDEDLNLMDITKLDSDRDGLPNIFEREITGTDPKNFDTDGDGLDDCYEYLVLGTDGTKADTDNNGVSDGDEDFDDDGLTNYEEYILGSNPFNADTDSDGLSDYDELYLYNTNPLEFDTDGDGVGDGDEIILGLDPLKKNTFAGILDSEYKVKQELNKDLLHVINSEENEYELSLTITASGYVARSIIEQESLYANSMKDNRAIIGTIAELDYNGGQIESATLKFKLKEEWISNPGSVYAAADPELEGVKRFCVFKFFEDSNMLLPIETYHDSDEGVVFADVDELGTYCLIDLEKWFYDLGIRPKEPEVTGQALVEPSDEVPSDYTAITLEELVAAVEKVSQATVTSSMNSTAVNAPVDIVFVVDTTGSMSNAINNVKVNIGNVITTLYNHGITPYVAVVDYTDYRNYGEQGAFVVKKANGEVWAYNKDEAIYLVSRLALRSGVDETPIDALEIARRLDYRSSAIKFIFLVTDEGYYVNNRYGIRSMSEMVSLLDADKIITSVVTSTGLKTRYQDLFLTTDGGWFNIYSNFSPQITDFIITRINDQNVFRAVLSSGLSTVILDAPLAKGGSTDTDKDGLTDSEEVLWDLITIEDGEVILPTLETCILNQKGYGEIGSWIMYLWDYIKDITILPVNSDPTRKDSDGDGYNDPDDPRPLKNDVIITKLSDADNFVPIKLGSSFCYGGDQDWSDNEKIKMGGCGTTAAANITAYYALHHDGYDQLYEYDTGPIIRSDFTTHIDNLGEFVNPIILHFCDPDTGYYFPVNIGVPTLSKFTRGVEKYAASKGVTLKGYWSPEEPNFANAVEYVKKGLKADAPVALIMFKNPKLTEVKWTYLGNTRNVIFNWHWVTITSMQEDKISGKTTVKVSSWGGHAVIDFKDVIEEELIYWGIMFFPVK